MAMNAPTSILPLYMDCGHPHTSPQRSPGLPLDSQHPRTAPVVNNQRRLMGTGVPRPQVLRSQSDYLCEAGSQQQPRSFPECTPHPHDPAFKQYSSLGAEKKLGSKSRSFHGIQLDPSRMHGTTVSTSHCGSQKTSLSSYQTDSECPTCACSGMTALSSLDKQVDDCSQYPSEHLSADCCSGTHSRVVGTHAGLTSDHISMSSGYGLSPLDTEQTGIYSTESKGLSSLFAEHSSGTGQPHYTRFMGTHTENKRPLSLGNTDVQSRPKLLHDGKCSSFDSALTSSTAMREHSGVKTRYPEYSFLQMGGTAGTGELLQTGTAESKHSFDTQQTGLDAKRLRPRAESSPLHSRDLSSQQHDISQVYSSSKGTAQYEAGNVDLYSRTGQTHLYGGLSDQHEASQFHSSPVRVERAAYAEDKDLSSHTRYGIKLGDVRSYSLDSKRNVSLYSKGDTWSDSPPICDDSLVSTYSDTVSGGITRLDPSALSPPRCSALEKPSRTDLLQEPGQSPRSDPQVSSQDRQGGQNPQEQLAWSQFQSEHRGIDQQVHLQSNLVQSKFHPDGTPQEVDPWENSAQGPSKPDRVPITSASQEPSPTITESHHSASASADHTHRVHSTGACCSVATLENERYSLDGICTPDHENEDRNFHIDCRDYKVFAVFDGHDGARAAGFACSYMHQLFDMPSWTSVVTKHSPDLVPEVMSEFFKTTEADFFKSIQGFIDEKERLQEEIPQNLSSYAAYQRFPYKVSRLQELEPKLTGGCTAVLAILVANRLYVANVGDSRAVLVYEEPNGTLAVQQLSVDHSVENEDELKRLEALGLDPNELIKSGRLGMHENVRSIGDYSIKQGYTDVDTLRKAHSAPGIAVPFVMPTKTVDHTYKYLVLMTDGVYKSIESTFEETMSIDSNKVLANMIETSLNRRQGEADRLSDDVLQRISRIHRDTYEKRAKKDPRSPVAVACRKRDDMTLIVYKFPDCGSLV